MSPGAAVNVESGTQPIGTRKPRMARDPLYLPWIRAALGGGGIASLRMDPQGKAFAQQLLEFPVPVPQSLAEALGRHGAAGPDTPR